MFHSGTARLGSRSNYWTQRSRGRSTVIVLSSPLLADPDDDPCHCIPTATLSKSVQAGNCENWQVIVKTGRWLWKLAGDCENWQVIVKTGRWLWKLAGDCENWQVIVKTVKWRGKYRHPINAANRGFAKCGLEISAAFRLYSFLPTSESGFTNPRILLL